jgi:UrcA family protein
VFAVMRFLVLAALVAVLPGMAQADEPIITRHVEVRIDDLNLSDEHDAALLLQRLETAARQACGGRPFSHNMHPAETAMRQDYDKCRTAALNRVLAEMRSQILDKLHGPAMARR